MLAYFAAFASDMDDCSAVVGRADVADIGPAELLGAQPGQQHSEDDREIALCPVGLPFGVAVLRYGLEQRLDSGPGEGLGQLRSAHVLHRVRGELFAGVEESAQHVPGRPAAADRCGLMIMSTMFMLAGRPPVARLARRDSELPRDDSPPRLQRDSQRDAEWLEPQRDAVTELVDAVGGRITADEFKAR